MGGRSASITDKNVWHRISLGSCRTTGQISRRGSGQALQSRIVKAVKRGRRNKVKVLQGILTRSFAAKLLAIRRITENSGKRTAGIDNELWNTPSTKAKATGELDRLGYRASAVRRIHIPKSNGKLRPLGIPTMKDRAMQALLLLGLDPVSESTADPNSYGFRPHRSCADAIARCFSMLAKPDAPVWILEGDIKGCCLVCKKRITVQTGWNVHHVQPKHLGGKWSQDNLVLLHPVCHVQVHQNSQVASQLTAALTISVKRA